MKGVGKGQSQALEVELQGVRQPQKDTRPHNQSFPSAGLAASGAGGMSSPLLEICKWGCCKEDPSTTMGSWTHDQARSL